MECMEVWGGNTAVSRSFSATGLQIWLHSQAHGSSEQGGDVYYVSSCASGRITRLLLADVSGHGEAAAGVATGLRDLMRRNINVINQTSFIQEMNQQFYDNSSSSVFATAVICTYYSPTRSLQFCHAGHPTALLFRVGTARWESAEQLASEDAGDGLLDMPLGVSDRSDYSNSVTKLAKGDLLLCVSDAFTESYNHAGQALGVDGLKEIVSGIDPSQPDEFLSNLIDQVGGAHSDNLEGDDASVLLIKADGGRPSFMANFLAPYRYVRGVRFRSRLG